MRYFTLVIYIGLFDRYESGTEGGILNPFNMVNGMFGLSISNMMNVKKIRGDLTVY